MNALPSGTDCEKSPLDITRELCDPVNTLKGAVFCLKTNVVTEQALGEMTVIMEHEILRLEDIILSLRRGSSERERPLSRSVARQTTDQIPSANHAVPSGIAHPVF